MDNLADVVKGIVLTVLNSGLWGFLAAWRQLFDRFDTDGSGNISFQEFSDALSGMSFHVCTSARLSYITNSSFHSFRISLESPVCPATVPKLR